MPRICSFYGIIIWIYYNDHNPPHFHATYGEFEILIRIADLSFIPETCLHVLLDWLWNGHQFIRKS
jgi:hypothetical protein